MMKLDRTYVYYRIGQFMAISAYRCLLFCIIWWGISEFSQEPYAMAAILGVPIVFRLISFVFVGYLIDTCRSKYLAVGADVLSALCLSGMFLVFMLPETSLFLIVFVLVLYNVASSVITPLDRVITLLMVNKKQLNLSINFQMNLELLAYLLASVLSGILLTYASIHLAIILAIVGCIISALISAKVIKKQAKIKRKNSIKLIFLSQANAFKQLYRIKTEWYFTLVSAVINTVIFCFVGFLLPLYVKSVLHLAAFYYTLNEFFIALGFLLTLFFIYRLLILVRKHDIFIVFAMLLLSAAFCLIFIAANIVSLCIATFIVGIVVAIYNTLTSSKRSLAVPAQYRGRLFSLVFLINEAAAPLGLLLITALSGVVNIQFIFFAFSILLILTIPMHYLIPKFTYFMRLNDSDLDGVYEKLYPSISDGDNSGGKP